MWPGIWGTAPSSANPAPYSTLSERARFPQYWPFRTSSRREPVNQKGSRLDAKESGSANRIRTDDLLVSSRACCSRLVCHKSSDIKACTKRQWLAILLARRALSLVVTRRP